MPLPLQGTLLFGQQIAFFFFFGGGAAEAWASCSLGFWDVGTRCWEFCSLQDPEGPLR